MPSEERKCESCDKDSHCSEDHKSRNYMDCAHYRQKQPTEGQKVCPKCGGEMEFVDDSEWYDADGTQHHDVLACTNANCGREEKVKP